MDTRTPQLIALIKDGASLEEAGRSVGLSRQRVSGILKCEGIDLQTLPGRGEARAQRRLNRVRERWPVLEAMWRQGMSDRQIARALGFSPSAVRQVIHERIPYEQRLVRAAHTHSKNRRLPDEWALAALRDAAHVLGRTPSCHKYDQLRKAGLIHGPAGSLIAARWGWSTACERAGLTPNPSSVRPGFGARRYTEQDLRAALQRVADLLGHRPSVREYEVHRRQQEPTSATIRHRHDGSWLAARSKLLNGAAGQGLQNPRSITAAYGERGVASG